jgi:hypothetical protein
MKIYQHIATPSVQVFLVILILCSVSGEILAANRLHWLGKEYFLLGVNYPWYNGYRGIDIGRLNASKEIKSYSYPVDVEGRIEIFSFPHVPSGGSGFDAIGIERQFEDMHNIGVRVIRWIWGWDGRDFFDLDQRENCTGVSPDVFTHLDLILQLAAKHHLYLVPVLLDFRFVAGDAPRNPQRRLRYRDGTTETPHANIIKDPKKRRIFIEQCIKPLVQRYRDSDHIIIWEIMNEAGNIAYGKDNQTGYTAKGGLKLPEDKLVRIDLLQEFFNEVYIAIKSVDQKHYVLSSGLARPNQLPMLVGRVKADLYGAHYNNDGVSDYGKVMSVSEIQKKYLTLFHWTLISHC